MSQAGEYAFPASFAQRRLWSVEQSEPAQGAYNVSFGLRFTGDLDPDHLAAALHFLEDRHESLRTTLVMEEGELRQVIGAAGGLCLARENLEASANGAEALGQARRVAEEAPFDLATGPLVRAVLYRLGEHDHALSITLHHSVVDVWSTEILVRELATAYNAIRRGSRPDLEPLPIQYADYSVWQIESQSTESVAAQLEYWRRELALPLPVLELPADHPRPPEPAHRGGRVAVDIGPEIVEPLRRLCRETGATPFMALLASFQAFLHQLTGQRDVVVGTPITGRNRPETAGLIGFFLNMLAIRCDWSGAPGYRELLAQVREKVLGAMGAQDVPFEHLVEVLRVPRDLSRHPVFQAVFVYQPAPGPVPEFSGCSVERLPSLPGGRAKFDLTLSIADGNDRLRATFEYDAALFEAATAERMGRQYLAMLRGLVGESEAGRASIAGRPAALAPEDAALLDAWNQTRTDYPRDATVVQLFEEQVDHAPDAVAIVTPGSDQAARLSYRELEARSNRLAHHLRGMGVAPGAMVAIALDRSADFVVAVLATLKAGAIYVPVDPALPADRLGVMLEDAQAKVLVTAGRLTLTLPTTGMRPVFLDRSADAIAREPDTRLPGVGAATSPAYVMYTSGSTGRPKGVVVPHRAIVRLVRNTNYVRLTAHDVLLACAPVSFDASTFELWGSLLNGGRLILYPDDIPVPADIGRLIAEYGVTTLWLTAGLFHLMAESSPGGFAGLRQLLAGGDVLSPTLVRQALASLGGGVLINGYGPTESTTFTCCYPMRGAGDVGETVPIGRPIANTRVYVLDEQQRPVPLGVRGELWAGGDGLALGYLNDPELTAARFRPDPFSQEPGARMYRTGDLVRYRADGVLEFFGRNDTQIKIRGFRVEAGEIERTICRYPGVSEALAVARERAAGDKQLVAYVVPARAGTIALGELKTFLRRHLPEYAVPSALVALQAFPLTPNGKIDHDALPEPGIEHSRPAGSADALQTQLLVIWEQVLRMSGIGVDDNFFDLGGNSLRAIDMLSSVGKALGRRVPVAALYRGQTVATMAQALRDEAVDPSLRAIAIQPRGTRPVLFIVPGVDGNVLGYEALARALGSDQPLYGLRSVGLDGEAEPLEDVADIAAALVPEVQRVQPRGPYRLAGFCMGGIVAYELAQQLAAKGEQTELLALVDTWAPEVIPQKRHRSRSGTQLAFLARGMARHVRSMWRQPTGGRLTYLLRKSRILGEMVMQRDVYRGDTHLLHRERVTRANQRAASRYRPAAYAGGLVLILSSERTLAPERDPRLSWKTLVRGTSTVIRVPGRDSGALLRAPHVLSLAAALLGELARVGAAS